jgi:hypothetical protein
MQRNEVILGARRDPPPRIGCFDALFQRKTAQRQQETKAGSTEYGVVVRSKLTAVGLEARQRGIPMIELAAAGRFEIHRRLIVHSQRTADRERRRMFGLDRRNRKKFVGQGRTA